MDNGAVAGTHHHLSLTVLVPVISNDILFVVLKVTHVRTTIDPPQTGAVHLQTFHDAVLLSIDASNFGTILRIRLRSLAIIIKLHQNLQLTIAIDIGTTGIIGNQRTLNSLVSQLNLLVSCCPRLHLFALCLFLTTHHRGNGVGTVHCTRLVRIVRHA